jgi:hypothetical protein
MVTYMTQAIGWALAHALGRPESEPVAHSKLEHTHWDRAEHRWYTHEDHTEETHGRAA